MMHIMIGEGIVIRVKSIAVFLCLLAPTLIAHRDLLPFGRGTNDVIELICFCALALNNPVIGKFSDRKIESKDKITLTPVITVSPGENK